MRRFKTHQNFPNVGNPNILYLDITENKLYRWDEAKLFYYVIGKHYDEIEIIHGGNT